MNLCLTRFLHVCTLLARYTTLLARYATLLACYTTLLARYDTLFARYDTLLAHYATFLTRYASCTLFWCSNTRWGLYTGKKSIPKNGLYIMCNLTIAWLTSKENTKLNFQRKRFVTIYFTV
jgi:hypothetical protein